MIMRTLDTRQCCNSGCMWSLILSLTLTGHVHGMHAASG